MSGLHEDEMDNDCLSRGMCGMVEELRCKHGKECFSFHVEDRVKDSQWKCKLCQHGIVVNGEIEQRALFPCGCVPVHMKCYWEENRKEFVTKCLGCDVKRYAVVPVFREPRKNPFAIRKIFEFRARRFQGRSQKYCRFGPKCPFVAERFPCPFTNHEDVTFPSRRQSLSVRNRQVVEDGWEGSPENELVETVRADRTSTLMGADCPICYTMSFDFISHDGMHHVCTDCFRNLASQRRLPPCPSCRRRMRPPE